MEKLALYYLVYLEGVLINLGQAKPIEYSYLPQPTCTTTTVSIPATQKPPTATVYDSIVTVTTSLATTVLSYMCEAGYRGSIVSTAANPTANDFTTISSLSPLTSITPSTSNPTANDSIAPTSPPLVTLMTSATCYTPTGPISSTPAKTVDGNGNPVPSGASGIIVRDRCPETKEEVAQCPLRCFAKSFGPNTPLFQCAQFFDDVRFHSCSPCLPPCDAPITSVSTSAGNSTTHTNSYS